MDVTQFHAIIAEGDLDAVRQTAAQFGEINAPGAQGQTALMVAIDAGDLEKIKLLLDLGADPELTDDFNRAPLRQAVQANFADAVRLLLSRGVERGHQPKYPLKPLNFGSLLSPQPVPDWMEGHMTPEEWAASQERLRETLANIDVLPTRPVIAEVTSVAVLQLLLDAGDDLSLAARAVQREYIGLGNGGEFQATADEYRRHRSPCYGTANPSRMDNPYWCDMIRIGQGAYSARTHFGDTDPFDGTGPAWCFERFGSTVTPLADGRFVQIAGEHEDHYDPDFVIYNDVVIHSGTGTFQIYGYPPDIFPPTDFHTATLVGEWIYIIGTVGYTELSATPVYRLQLETWRIEPVETAGEIPVSLHNHQAHYDQQRHVIRLTGGECEVKSDTPPHAAVPTTDAFELDLTSLQWQRLRATGEPD